MSTETTLSNGKRELTPAEKQEAVIDAKLQNIKKYLNEHKQSIAEACSQGIDPDRLIKTAMLILNSKETRAVSKSSGNSILDCSAVSILRAIASCARMGLTPDWGNVYFVPYRNGNVLEAELQIGYTGLITLAKRSNVIRSIQAEIVCEGDFFEIENGSDPKFIHRPKFSGANEQFVYVYALATFTDGHFEYCVMTRDEVQKIRNASKAPQSPAWKNWFIQMAKKSVLRRLCRTLPLTIESQSAIDADDRANFVIDVESASAASVPNGTPQVAAAVDHALAKIIPHAMHEPQAESEAIDEANDEPFADVNND